MIIKRYIIKYLKYKLYNPKQFWNEFGGQKYFDKFHGKDPRYEDIFLQAIEKYHPKTVIDIGCGYGRYLKSISDVYPQMLLHGVDIAESQIEKAREYLYGYNNISLSVVYNNILPFDNNIFDIAITFGCFSAVKKEDFSHFFNEIERVTKKFGVFIEYCHFGDGSKGNSKHYWYAHNYDHLFQNNNYMQKQLNETGDSLFIVEF